MRVLVSGGRGCLGRVLVPRLLADPAVEAVTTVDRRPMATSHPRHRHHRVDLTAADPYRLLHGHDALVHLAFVVMRSHLGRAAYDRERVRAINVTAGLRLLGAAGELGLGAAVFLSSAAVYGAWPDHPPCLTEDTPLRGIPGFAYAEDKIAVERGLQALAARHPDTRYVSLRPHVILGRHAQPYLKRLLTAPLAPRFPEPEPRLQCVWEEDVAEAVQAALTRPVRGPFNLAADPPVTLHRLRRAAGVRGLRLPFPWLAAAMRLAWRLTPRVEDPAWLNGAAHDLVLDCRRARQELGWHPSRDTLACARDTVRARP